MYQNNTNTLVLETINPTTDRVNYEYLLLKAEEPDLLSSKVNEHLVNGWRLYGNTSVYRYGFLQAMVRMYGYETGECEKYKT